MEMFREKEIYLIIYYFLYIYIYFFFAVFEQNLQCKCPAYFDEFLQYG